MHDSLIRRYARRVAKGAWWLATPWRMKQRIRFMRDRAATAARAAELARLIGLEQERRSLRALGLAPEPVPVFDLFDAASVARAIDMPEGAIRWPAVAPGDVIDRKSAIRFCLDLWRERGDLRASFPGGLDGRYETGLATWLQARGRAELGLSQAALQAGVADRARQAFVATEAVASACPQGLTPPGMRDLFRWFMRCALKEFNLRPEEVWWLFLEAAQDPGRELMLAHAFTPAWQQRQPDGMTVFGREAFVAWFADDYGACGRWLDPSNWPDWQDPALQIRTAYWAHESWRRAHPAALVDSASARSMLAWLSSAEAGQTEAARDCAGGSIRTGWATNWSGWASISSGISAIRQACGSRPNRSSRRRGWPVSRWPCATSEPTPRMIPIMSTSAAWSATK